MTHGAEAAVAKLVRMANQVGVAFRLQPPDEAAGAVAEHLRLFWTPKMRRDIAAYLQQGGEGLDPLARQAVEKLKAS